MKTVFILLFGLLFQLFIATIAYSQVNIDSLEVVVKTQTGETKCKTLVKLVNVYEKKNKELSLNYANQLVETTLQSSSKTQICDAYSIRGGLYLSDNNLEKAESDFMHCLDYTGGINNLREAGVYNNLGRLYVLKGDDEKALAYFQKSLAIKDKLNAKDPDNNEILQSISAAYTNIGTIYLNRGDYKEAISSYYKALTIQEEGKNMLQAAIIRNNIGSIYMYQTEYDKAINEFMISLNTREKLNDKNGVATVKINLGVVYLKKEDYKTAEKYFFEALEIRKNSTNTQSIAGIYENLGIIRKNQKRYPEALDYYEKSLQLRLKDPNKKFLVNSYANLGNIYFILKDYKKAEEYLSKGIEMANELKTPEAAKEIYGTLSKLNAEKGKSEDALKFYKKYIEVKDSINNVDVQATIAELKEKYEAEKKNKIIDRLKQEKKYSELMTSKKSQAIELLLALLVLSIAIVIIVVYSTWNKRRSEKKIFLQKQEIDRQKMLDVIKTHEVKNMDAYLKGQELERNRLAADLHDRLGSLLSTVKLHFSAIAETSNGDQKEKDHLNYTLTLVDKSIEEVRHVSHNLAKGILTQFGLIAAVKEVASAVNAANQLKLIIEIKGAERRFQSDKEIVLMTVLQELITNTIKHAHAQTIKILFDFEKNPLQILFSDDGKGFNTSHFEEGSGFGITNIKARMAKINEEITFESSPNMGLLVNLTLSNKDLMPEYQ